MEYTLRKHIFCVSETSVYTVIKWAKKSTLNMSTSRRSFIEQSTIIQNLMKAVQTQDKL